MSLSTLIEAAKYLDYLDSSGQQHHDGGIPMVASAHQQPDQPRTRRSNKRQRSGKNDNMMFAMSLPHSASGLSSHHYSHTVRGVPIPMVSGAAAHQAAASLSSSFTTGSSLSSSASTAIFGSKVSGVTSASSSAASSLSSSDSSSSCGETLMAENNEFNSSNHHQPGKRKNSSTHYNHHDHHNYHMSHQKQSHEANHQSSSLSSSSSLQHSHGKSGSAARFMASSGPQLVTMSSSLNDAGTDTFKRRFSVSSGAKLVHQALSGEPQTFNIASGATDNVTPGSPMIMARVQPLILNPMSPPSQAAAGLMAFQQTIASSPTSSSSSYSRHRELHKTLEKNRRAHLRYCFELLKGELPASECVDKKASHINIIKSAIRYVLALRQQESELEQEYQRMMKIKSELTESISKLRLSSDRSQSDGSSNEQAHELESKAGRHQEQKEEKHQKQMNLDQQSSTSSPSSIQQQPAAEQQLSFLLSQSKID